MSTKLLIARLLLLLVFSLRAYSQVTILDERTAVVGGDPDFPGYAVTEWVGQAGDTFVPINNEIRLRITPPVGVEGKWHFLQVQFRSDSEALTEALTEAAGVAVAEAEAAVEAATTEAARADAVAALTTAEALAEAAAVGTVFLVNNSAGLDANDSIAGLGTIPADVRGRRYDRSAPLENYNAHRSPETVSFYEGVVTDDGITDEEITGSRDLRFHAFSSNSSVQWQMQVRAFYRIKTDDQTSFENTIFTTERDSNHVLAGQDLRVAFQIPTDSLEGRPGGVSIEKVTVFQDGTRIGQAELDEGEWKITIPDIRQDKSSISAYVENTDGTSAWTPAFDLVGAWYSVKIRFGASFKAGFQLLGDDYYLLGTGGEWIDVREIADQNSFEDSAILESFSVAGYPAGANWYYGWDRKALIENLAQSNHPLAKGVELGGIALNDQYGKPRKWEIKVPSDSIEVELIFLDKIVNSGEKHFLIEGRERAFSTYQIQQDDEITSYRHKEVIQVTDGRLTIEGLHGGKAPILNEIVIRQTGSGQNIRGSSSFVYWPYDEVGGVTFTVRPQTGQVGVTARQPFGYGDDIIKNYFYIIPGGIYFKAGGLPFVSYGEYFGGSPLYRQLAYSYEFSPAYLEVNEIKPEMKLISYHKKSGEMVAEYELQLDELNEWESFPTTDDVGAVGAQISEGRIRSFDIDARDAGVDEKSLKLDIGLSLDSLFSPYAKNWNLTHRGGNPNHYYVLEANSHVRTVEGEGAAQTQTFHSFSKSVDGSGADDVPGDDIYTRLFAFAVEDLPASTVNLSKPSFQGKPRPSDYYGLSVAEIKDSNTKKLSERVKLVEDESGLSFVPETEANGSSQDAAVLNQIRGDLSLGLSPELRSHTILNEFFNERMNGNALAITNFVHNEIRLSEAISYNQAYDDDGFSIDPGGIQRAALGCLLERRGSPHEQCALLVYLLRKADIPAVYLEANRNQLLMDSAVVSRMLSMQIDPSPDAPSLVALNYPWVGAYIDGKWEHLFPWIEETEITEGYDLYSLLPEEVNSGWKWVWKYFQGDPDVLPFQLRRLTPTLEPEDDGVLFKKEMVFDEGKEQRRPLPEAYQDLEGLPDFDQPYQLFKRYVKWQLQESGLDISLDDIGIQKRIRPRYFSRWEDFPKPLKVSGPITVRKGWNEVPRIFDTIRYEFVKKERRARPDGAKLGEGEDERNPYFITETLLDSGELLLCDIHNRKLYAQRGNFIGDQQSAQEIALVMAPYDSLIGGSVSDLYADDFRFPDWNQELKYDEPGKTMLEMAEGEKGRAQFVALPAFDDDDPFLIDVRITHKRHRHSGSIANRYFENTLNSFLFSAFSLDEMVRGYEYTDTNALEQGLFALCVNTGSVTKEMLEVHTRELWGEDEDEPSEYTAKGTRAFLMGMSYWEYMTRFKEEYAQLHKIVYQGDYGHLFSGLKIDVRTGAPSLPSIDIYRGDTNSVAYGGRLTPYRGMALGDVSEDFNHFLGCQGSAYEHGVMEQFYGQVGAISTIRIFHLAKAARVQALADKDPTEVDKNELLVFNATEESLNEIDSASLVHELDGLEASPMSEGPGLVARELATSSRGQRRGALVVVAPKYYTYYDDGDLALDCAAWAPVPGGGTLGGTIATDFLVRNANYVALIAGPHSGTDNTAYAAGRFTAPQRTPSSTRKMFEGQFDFSDFGFGGNVPYGEVVTLRVEANDDEILRPQNFTSWEISYYDSQKGENVMLSLPSESVGSRGSLILDNREIGGLKLYLAGQDSRDGKMIPYIANKIPRFFVEANFNERDFVNLLLNVSGPHTSKIDNGYYTAGRFTSPKQTEYFNRAQGTTLVAYRLHQGRATTFNTSAWPGGRGGYVSSRFRGWRIYAVNDPETNLGNDNRIDGDFFISSSSRSNVAIELNGRDLLVTSDRRTFRIPRVSLNEEDEVSHRIEAVYDLRLPAINVGLSRYIQTASAGVNDRFSLVNNGVGSIRIRFREKSTGTNRDGWYPSVPPFFTERYLNNSQSYVWDIGTRTKFSGSPTLYTQKDLEVEVFQVGKQTIYIRLDGVRSNSSFTFDVQRRDITFPTTTLNRGPAISNTPIDWSKE